jgi:hypothetical protein
MKYLQQIQVTCKRAQQNKWLSDICTLILLAQIAPEADAPVNPETNTTHTFLKNGRVKKLIRK